MPEKQEIKSRIINSAQFRKVDEEARTIEFVASDSSIDSYNTSLPVNKWSLDRFNSNGIVGYMHDVYGDDSWKSADPDDVIGKGFAFVEDEKLIVRITFEPKSLNEKADKIFKKIQFGSLKAVSVGFRQTAPGHWGKKKDGEEENCYYYNGQELLEISVVNIPANPNALKRSIDAELAELPEKPCVKAAEDKKDDIEINKNKEPKAIGAEELLLIIASADFAMAQSNYCNEEII